METNFDTLMRQVCADWGHCGSVQDGRFAHVTDYIPEDGTVNATQFAEWVLTAEGEADGSSPHLLRWRQKLQDAFIEHMGAEDVDADRLRYRSR